MKKSAVDILLISMNLIFKSMSHPKQPARAQATVHKIMILLSNQNRVSWIFWQVNKSVSLIHFFSYVTETI